MLARMGETSGSEVVIRADNRRAVSWPVQWVLGSRS